MKIRFFFIFFISLPLLQLHLYYRYLFSVTFALHGRHGRDSIESSSIDDGAKKRNKTYVTLIILAPTVCGKRLFQDGFLNERKSYSK